MKKYLYYIFVSLTSILLKVIGNPIFPFVWIAFSVRKWARESVYSYVLENNKTLKRLQERRPEETADGWILHGYEYQGGFVKRRNVSKIRYLIAMIFWVFVDDDSDVDTYCYGHNKTYINGERKAPDFLIKEMIKANKEAVQGSQFELGDRRGDNPRLNFVSTFYWTGRNSAYNFNYKFLQINDESLVWYKKIGKLEFGWKEDGVLNGVKYYKRIMGYNF